MEAEEYDCDLPEAFGPGYDFKYLLIEVTGGEGAKKRRWVVVSRKCHYHSGVLSAFEEENDEARDVRVHGGGILVCDANTGEVRCFGSSGGYGSVKKLDIVAKCLATLGRPVGSVLATDYVRD